MMGSINQGSIGISEAIADDPNYVNILLLGETGVGKSTFVNAFVNYITYNDIETALKNPLLYLIPAQFFFHDEEKGEQTQVKVGNDDNEKPEEIGQAVTQSCRSYVFPYVNGKKLRFIDTPGVGDPRGTEKDYENMENFLDFIAQFKSISAFIILLQSNTTRLTPSYEYCIKEILTRLEKKAAENIVFVFTHARGSFYRPGESKAVLKQFLKNLQNKLNIEIPLTPQNSFCVDNESFRFLVASEKGIKLSEQMKQEYEKSWNISDKEYTRLLAYIIGDEKAPGLKAHDLKTTLSINEARRMIVLISKPLVNISELISHNQNLVKSLIEDNTNLDNKLKTLEGDLKIRTIKYKTIPQDKPITVCAGENCKTVTKVANQPFYIYNQKCHDPCYLRDITPDIVGPSELVYCAAIDDTTQQCMICGCDFKLHMHIYYQLEPYESEEEVAEVKSKILNFKSKYDKNKIMKNAYDQKIREYNDELKKIRESMAIFAYFLKKHSLVPYNDAYEKYMEMMKKNAGSIQLKEKYQKMLEEYNQQKVIFDKVHREKDLDVEITPQKIDEIMKGLFNLKNFGIALKEMYDTQINGAKNVIQNKEKQYTGLNSSKQSKIMSREIVVSDNMLQYALGKSNFYLYLIEKMESVEIVRADQNKFSIKGNNEDEVRRAAEMLDVKKVRVEISKNDYNNAKFLENIKDKFKLRAVVKNKHVTTPTIWLVGEVNDIGRAKEYLVDRGRNLSM